jgi:putative oxidoreductase
MATFLARYADVTYALLRFMSGALFACHGAQKILGLLGGTKAAEPLMQVGGIIELVGGIMIAVGLQAGWAAFIASGMMAAAYFMVHAGQGFWPIVNKGELAVLYCFVFLYIAARGSGRFSVDAALRKPAAR